MEIANLAQPPFPATLTGCLKGASGYFELGLSQAMLYGLVMRFSPISTPILSQPVPTSGRRAGSCSSWRVAASDSPLTTLC